MEKVNVKGRRKGIEKGKVTCKKRKRRESGRERIYVDVAREKKERKMRE